MKGLSFDPICNEWKSRCDIDIPTPVSNQVRVRVLACGLNPVDAKIGFWKELVPQMDNNHVAGLDVCGIVDAIGEDVDSCLNIKVGSRVLYHGNMLKSNGGFAEYAIHDANTLINLDNLVSAEQFTDQLICKLAASPCAAW